MVFDSQAGRIGIAPVNCKSASLSIFALHAMLFTISCDSCFEARKVGYSPVSFWV